MFVFIELDEQLLEHTHLALVGLLVQIFIEFKPLSGFWVVIFILIVLVYGNWPVIIDNAGDEGEVSVFEFGEFG